MTYSWIRILLTAAAGSLAVVHLLWPMLAIDTVTLALIVLAALPWYLPLLKSLELPGRIKIELRDVKTATEKITSEAITGKGELKAGPAAVSGRGEVRFTDSIGTLRHVADRDPTLAVVGFRIEIEKRLLQIAEANQIDVRRMPLSRLVGELRTREILPPN